MKYKLPKGYLSWSQINLWESSPQKYIDRYINNKKPFVTKEMMFGKLFADFLEKGECGNKFIDQIIKLIPKRQYKEAESDVVIDGVPLKLVFDSVDDEGFEEYKTGKAPWDINRVRNHGQLLLYDIAFREIKGIEPEIALTWIPTKENEEGQIELVGEVHSFSISFSDEERDAFKERIKKVAEEITNYKDYIKKEITI